MIVDKPQKAGSPGARGEKEAPGLKLIILMEPFGGPERQRPKSAGVVIKSMQDVEVRSASGLFPGPQLVGP